MSQPSSILVVVFRNLVISHSGMAGDLRNRLRLIVVELNLVRAASAPRRGIWR